MGTKFFAAIPVALALVASTTSQGQQFTNPGNFGWWHTVNAGTNPQPTRGVSIGNAGAGPYPSAFQVRGELTWTQTPEVFRTTAPTTGLTSWRMFQGGTTAGFERGQLFADPANTNFNINAPNGGFLLLTQNVQRARFNGNVLGPIGLFPAINRDGFLMLSGQPNAFVNAGNSAPFTRLHLIDGVGPADPITYAQTIGFRPWQRNGITFTGNSDQSYIGHRYAGDDNTDFVIQWSDNPNGSPWGVDRMKFVFTTQFDPAAPRGAATADGVEAIRLWPRNNLEVNVGIGDFAPAAVGDPTERLDILSGRVRIRELPDGINQAQAPFWVVVVDNTAAPSAQRGVLRWRDANQLDCKWTLTNNLVNHVYTAVGPPGVPCPDDLDAVGIGIDLSVNLAPSAKLNVNTAAFDEGASIIQTHADANVYGLRIDARGGAQNNYGARILATANGTAVHNYGLFTEAFGATPRSRAVSARTNGATLTAYCGEFLAYDNASWTHGVTGRAYGGNSRHGVEGLAFAGSAGGSWGTASELFGVRARAEGGGASSIGFGIRAGATGSTVNWAGWFDGDVNISGDIYLYGTYYASDAALKTEVQDIAPTINVVEALRVHSYQFTDEAITNLGMPAGEQVGLIAQELEEVLPRLVKEHTVPAEYDSTGSLIAEAFSYKAVNYVGLIPYLISAVQKLEADNDIMREQLAACCARPSGADGRMQVGMGEVIEGDARSLSIQPNPFNEQTTLSYTLERSGRAQLLVNSADGKQLKALFEAVQEAGQYQYTWNTGDLVPGVYYVTLLLDGEPLVKKAVKVSR